ncbi:hypothetical protein GCM10020331_067120 [Ectobacillus funiculus]
MLHDQGYNDIQWGDDFGAPHETAIAESFEKAGIYYALSGKKIKAFYMKPDPNRPDVVLCADLIAPEGYGELIGGSQRIDDYDFLKTKIR